MVVEMGCLEGGRGGGSSIAAPHASLTFARDPGDEPEQWDSSQHTGRPLARGEDHSIVARLEQQRCVFTQTLVSAYTITLLLFYIPALTFFQD